MQKKIKMKSWQGLKQGDVVDLVAPGFRSGPEELRSAEEFIRSWGLVPRVPQGIFGDDVLSSNSDEARFQMLKSALTAPDSQAVWCLRGGYGSIRLLPDLLKLKKPAGDAKLFFLIINSKVSTANSRILRRAGMQVDSSQVSISQQTVGNDPLCQI